METTVALAPRLAGTGDRNPANRLAAAIGTGHAPAGRNMEQLHLVANGLLAVLFGLAGLALSRK